MRILVGGDTHCSRTQIKYLYDQALRLEVDLIIQVGDFGYWPVHMRGGVEYLETCEKHARKTGIELWWLDGNHEDHDQLVLMCNNATEVPVITGRFSSEGNWISYPHLKYLPRGYRFELDGISFMSYGGAYSVDRKYRTKFVDWFPQEMIDHEHIESIEPIHADVLLTHDVPLGYKFAYDEFSQDSIISRTARESLYILLQKLTPYVCIGGHHHIYDKYRVKHDNGYTQCYITNCDGFGHQSYYLLDTDIVKEWKNIYEGAEKIDNEKSL